MPRSRQLGVTIVEIVIAVAVLATTTIMFSLRMKKQMTATRRTSAKVNTRMLESRLKSYYIERATFPVGSAGPTPSRACCDFPDQRCPYDMQSWRADRIWSELDFAIEEPERFQYSYTGTEREFTIKAIGNPECDGPAEVTTVRGTARDGMVTVTHEE